MKRNTMQLVLAKFLAIAVICSNAVTGFAAGTENDTKWHVGVGARGNVGQTKTTWKNGSMGGYTPARLDTTRAVKELQSGPRDGAHPRHYDDGDVVPDGTTSPNNNYLSYNWNIRPGAVMDHEAEVALHDTSFRDTMSRNFTSGGSSGGKSEKETSWWPTIELSFLRDSSDHKLTYGFVTTIGVQSLESSSGGTFAGTDTRTTEGDIVTDIFEIVPASDPPPIPSSGASTGRPIASVPVWRGVEHYSSSQVTDFNGTWQSSMDGLAIVLRPAFRLDRNFNVGKKGSRLSVGAEVGPTFTFASADFTTSGTTYSGGQLLGSSSTSKSESGFAVGVEALALLTYKIHNGWSLFGGIGYQWSQDLDLDSVILNQTGWRGTFGASYTF